MKKRTISSIGFVIVVVCTFLLREKVDYRLFHLLPWFMCAVGTYEMARALKHYILPGWYSILCIYGFLFCPVYWLIEFRYLPEYGAYYAIGLCILVLAIAGIQAFIFQVKPKIYKRTALAILYPSILILPWLLCNDFNNLDYGFIALLLLFVISPCADSLAYLVGMCWNKIRKGNAKKLCPKISPNKTVAGAIGGIIGGVGGAYLVWLIFGCEAFAPYWFFLIIGLIGSILDELGDLYESSIKRKAHIKDMGKIMPGHGGIMDRIDGMLFVGIFIYIMFRVFVI